MNPAFAALTSAVRSAADNVPQAGVDGGEPEGLSTATACRYVPHLSELPLATTSFTSAHVGDANVCVTVLPTADVPSPKSQ